MLDQTDQKILQCLQSDSRMQWQEIGKIVHLTGQAVAVRIRNMQDEGIIEAFTVKLNHEKLGRPINALITVFMSSAKHVSFLRFLADNSYVVEAYRVTGEGCYWLKANLANQEQLNNLLDDILLYGNYKVNMAIDKIK
ncbi:MAG TPA: Lrp/AsnC family transcriptional regulator [Desulfosporosinus sp.]|nr:Lrp/AsnC family transcriptional regulator [Desulfosporosinus sp.]